MAQTNALQLYKEHYVDKGDERLALFQLLAARFGIESALYPGSFVHLTPSFVFPIVTYVDTDKRAPKFFSDSQVADFIARHKSYPQDAQFTFHAADYSHEFGETDGSFDLLISQYAGFVSQSCKRYLKPDALLLVNNSHGDAGMASLDGDYEFIAAITHRSGKYRLIEENLDAYFVPKSQRKVTKEYLQKHRRGVGYKKSAYAYLFRLSA